MSPYHPEDEFDRDDRRFIILLCTLAVLCVVGLALSLAGCSWDLGLTTQGSVKDERRELSVKTGTSPSGPTTDQARIPPAQGSAEDEKPDSSPPEPSR